MNTADSDSTQWSVPQSAAGDATGGIIPYKNPHALIAYYLGIFSCLPFLGFFLGCAAVPLGIIGLKKRKANPLIKGSVHAWIGIVCGSMGILFYGFFIVTMIVAGILAR